MAVSGSTDFNLEAAEVIQEAYERCGLQETSGKDLRTAIRSMNLLLAEWANRGLNLWTITLGTQLTKHQKGSRLSFILNEQRHQLYFYIQHLIYLRTL